MGAELAREAFGRLKGLFAGKLRSHMGYPFLSEQQRTPPIPPTLAKQRFPSTLAHQAR